MYPTIFEKPHGIPWVHYFCAALFIFAALEALYFLCKILNKVLHKKFKPDGLGYLNYLGVFVTVMLFSGPFYVLTGEPLIVNYTASIESHYRVHNVTLIQSGNFDYLMESDKDGSLIECNVQEGPHRTFDLYHCFSGGKPVLIDSYKK